MLQQSQKNAAAAATGSADNSDSDFESEQKDSHHSTSTDLNRLMLRYRSQYLNDQKRDMHKRGGSSGIFSGFFSQTAAAPDGTSDVVNPMSKQKKEVDGEKKDEEEYQNGETPAVALFRKSAPEDVRDNNNNSTRNTRNRLIEQRRKQQRKQRNQNNKKKKKSRFEQAPVQQSSNGVEMVVVHSNTETNALTQNQHAESNAESNVESVAESNAESHTITKTITRRKSMSKVTLQQLRSGLQYPWEVSRTYYKRSMYHV